MKQSQRNRAVFYFGAVQFLYYASTGLWNFCNIYFRELGFTGQEVGMLTAGGTFLTMVLLPLLGILGDKLRSPRRIFLWALAVQFPLYLLLPVFGGAFGAALVPFVILAAVIRFAVSVANTMMDSWNSAELDKIGVPFSATRWYGSLGFVIVCFACSAVVGPVLPSWSCCIIMPLLGLPLVLLVRRRDMETTVPRSKQEKTVSAGVLLRVVFKNYYFVNYLLLDLAFSAFLAIVNLCLSYLMDYAGASQSSLGVVSAVRAAAEIVAMFWLGRSKKRPPNWVLLAVACLMVAAEHLIYPWMTSLGLMVAACLLSGVGGGLFYGIGANYVLQIVDHRAVSTAMSVLGMEKAIIGIVGATLGGTIIDRFGVTTLTSGVGVLILVLTAVFVGSCILGRHVWKKPYVNEKVDAAL